MSTDASNDGNFMLQSILFSTILIYSHAVRSPICGVKSLRAMSFFNIFLPAVYLCPLIYTKFS
jgi:hypothetical protein